MTSSAQSCELPVSVDPRTVVRGTFGPHEHPGVGAFEPASTWLDINFSEYGDGYARAHMRVRTEMLNGFNVAHGGMIFALADTCFAWACNYPDGDGSVLSVTQGADINFLSSPSEGTMLTAVGIRYPSSGRSGICDVTVTDDCNRVIAEFRGRYRDVKDMRRTQGHPDIPEQPPRCLG